MLADEEATTMKKCRTFDLRGFSYADYTLEVVLDQWAMAWPLYSLRIWVDVVDRLKDSASDVLSADEFGLGKKWATLAVRR